MAGPNRRIACRWKGEDRDLILARILPDEQRIAGDMPADVDYPEVEVRPEDDPPLYGRDWYEWMLAADDDGVLYPEIDEE